MTNRYHIKVFVITGASSDLGAELARQLAGRGHRLVLAGRDEARLQSVAAACNKRGAQVLVVPTDVTVEQDCQHLMQRTIEAFGQIDVLINNAGVSMHANFDVTDLSSFERLWRVNCLGTIHCTRFAYPYMRAIGIKRPGLIVGICSPAGRKGLPGRTAECASKFAQAGFLEALRIEAANYSIGVTVVYAGFMATARRRHRPRAAGDVAGADGLDESAPMIMQDCVRQIVVAIRKRKRVLVVTRRGRLTRWLKLIAPPWSMRSRAPP